MEKASMFWQTYLNLEREVTEVSKYIFFTDEVWENGNVRPCENQIFTFSPYLADLLIRCCVQIEALSKEIYFDNGGEKARGDKTILFDRDCLKFIDEKWKTNEKEVLVVAPFFSLKNPENAILKPLKNAYRGGKPYWKTAYQAVKHDRFSSLSKGNVKAVLGALAALYLLNIYHRKDSWITTHNDIPKCDYSMGSMVFSVRAPKADGIWYGNGPIDSESPYVVKYQDADYQRIKEMQEREKDVLVEYFANQPESGDPEFLAYLQSLCNSEQAVMVLCELGKFRLNKMIPEELSFGEKKERLVGSKEWNSKMFRRNCHMTPDDLTEDNIHEVIDRVATYWGMEKTFEHQKGSWIPTATNSKICEVYIP